MTQRSSKNLISILIPAYNPTENLIGIVRELSKLYEVYVVNDGSGKASDSIFNTIKRIDNCTVFEHAENQGKGMALKTGIREIKKRNIFSGIITADADGQHSVKDIVNIAEKFKISPSIFILGVRNFTENIPFRSKFGNMITKFIFYLITRVFLKDTQSGLRAIPSKYFNDLLNIKSSRYDYELEMLLQLIKNKARIKQEEIETIYLNNNQSSHFNPLFDSLKIYFVFLRFFSLSITTALIDYIFFIFVYFILNNIIISLLIGRSFACIYNFIVAKNFVFKSNGNLYYESLKYITLVLLFTSLTYTSINFLINQFAMNPIFAKILSEGSLFILSFVIQRNFVFNHKDLK